jgi:glycosyltransferase involved in cell wall biosynthesis
MNVLHLASWYPIAEKPNFGTFIRAHATAIANSLEAEQDKHLLIAIVCRPEGVGQLKGKTIRHEQHGKLNVIVLEVRSHLWKLYQHWPNWFRLQAERLLKANNPGFRPDLIHAHVAFPVGVVAQAMSRNWKVQFLISEHWSGAVRQSKQPILGRLSRLAYQQAGAITMVSALLLDDLKNAGLIGLKKPESLVLIPNVLEGDFRYLSKSNSNRTFLVLMNLSAPKRPDLIIKAVGSLKNNWPNDAEVLIVGKGPYLDGLQTEVDQLHLPIRFVDTVAKEQVPSLMHNTTALWHPTDYETFGLVVIEAMACGTPVLCSDFPSLASLVKDLPTSSGTRLVQNTVEEWIKAIKAHLEMDFGTEQRNQLLEIANATQIKYSPARVAQQFYEVYRQLSSPR